MGTKRGDLDLDVVFSAVPLALPLKPDREGLEAKRLSLQEEAIRSANLRITESPPLKP